jgi:hypothetical protein
MRGVQGFIQKTNHAEFASAIKLSGVFLKALRNVRTTDIESVYLNLQKAHLRFSGH